MYANRKLASRLGPTPLLFPFWGSAPKDSMPFQKAVFAKHNFDKFYYGLAGRIEEADYVLLPHNFWNFKKKYPDLLSECVKEADKHKKPLLIDAQGDSASPINFKNAVILRTSQYRFRMKENEIMIPAYAEDLLESYFNGSLRLRRKSALPVVGFAGWADMPLKLKIKTFIKEIPKRAVFKKGIYFRKKALAALEKSSLVKTNFMARSFHSAHTATAKGDMDKLRREFVNNMLESDYILCSKGDGNYSIRFYEALSMGRIPLFVDTECVLPLEDIINYKDFCVFVDWRDLENIDKILSDFHKSVSGDRFIEMQKRARSAFENYLRIDSFTKYLTEKLRSKLLLFW